MKIKISENETMKRILSLIAVGVLLASASAFAQSPPYLQGQQLRLVNTGQTYGGILIAPNPVGADVVFNLPAAGGTLVTTATAGWLNGGQARSNGTPGLMGATDAEDVSLISDNTPRLTLLGTMRLRVVLPDETELRLGDDAGGQYIALKAPTTVKTANITYILPDTLPGGPNVRMKVESIAGNEVTVSYTDPTTTGQIGFQQSGVTTCDDGTDPNGTGWYDADGISFTVGPNAIYSFEVYVDVTDKDANITFWDRTANGAGAADPAGVVIRYKVINLTD